MATQEMGGALTGHSDGPGLGAVFTLDLPFQPKRNASMNSLNTQSGHGSW